jgi:hypothetical protein
MPALLCGEPGDELVDRLGGNDATTADLDGLELFGTDQLVESRAANAEFEPCLLDRQEAWQGGQADVPATYSGRGGHRLGSEIPSSVI